MNNLKQRCGPICKGTAKWAAALALLAVLLLQQSVYAATRSASDNFSSGNYTGGAGSFGGADGWGNSPWVEGPESNGPTTGNVRVSSGQAYVRSNSYLVRSLNLSGAASATISITYSEAGDLEYDDLAFLEICSDTTFTNCQVMMSAANDFGGPITLTNKPIAHDKITATTTIRGRTVGYAETGEIFYFDNVQISAVFPDPGQIIGSVFLDTDSDGGADFGETGVAGVTVTAYNNAGVAAATAATDANGNYTLAGLTDGIEYRLEFTGLPAGLEPGPHGYNSATTVAFATSPDTVEVGLVDPRIGSNPRLATAVYHNGSGSGNTGVGYISFPYDASGIASNKIGGSAGSGTAFTQDAQVQQIGTVWGAAYQLDSQRLFTAAFLKRHSGFGPRGADGVYIFDYTTTPATLLGGFDLQGITPANGGSAIDLGTVCRQGPPTCDPFSTGSAADYTLPANPATESIDLDAFNKVGRVSYGDIDLSEDGRTLWLVNLNQDALISVDVSDPAVLPPAATVNQYPLSGLSGWPSCANGLARPWALKFANDRGYLGVVCNAETSQNRADLAAYILSFNPANLAAGFTTEVNFALNYNREQASTFGVGPDLWQPWARTWTDTGFGASIGTEATFPQPIVSDIEFADDGSMVLDLLDRWGHQAGYDNRLAIAGTTNLLRTDSGGDIIHACFSGGAYILEGQPGCPENDTGAVGLGNDGPSGTGEFYYQDIVQSNTPEYHFELTTGGLAMLPGRGEVATTAFDPILEDFTQGFQWHSTSTGQRLREYEVTEAGSLQYGGKANGLGDLELITDPAPIEVGNRIWEDVDGDGIQDPGELGLNNLVVTLHDMDNGGVQVGSATTDVDGDYYFGGLANANMTSGSILPNRDYELRVDTTQSNLAGFGLSPGNTNGQTDNNNQTDLRDSDATLDSGNAVIAFATGRRGANNHTLDFGFTPFLVDWGDLPDTGSGTGTGNYNTLAGDNGPSHLLGGAYLGACVDGESDGQPDVEAGLDGIGGDDPAIGAPVIGTCASGSDEDGVFALTPFMAGRPGAFQVATSGNSCLSVFVDFDGDGLLDVPVIAAGSPSGAAGNPLSDVALTGSGPHVFFIDVPPTTTGVMYSRFRLTAVCGEGGASPTGPALSGEVEDYVLAAVGDTVWEDADLNGLQGDADTANNDGLIVRLLDGSGNPVTDAAGVPITTLTAVDGTYSFPGLIPGVNFMVEFTAPAGYGFTPRDQGGDDTLDSDANVFDGRTVPFIVGPAVVDNTRDAGIYLINNPSVGNRVWADQGTGGGVQNDGILNGGELGIAGAAVQLRRDADANGLDASDPILASYATDSAGFYIFPNVTPASDYFVCVVGSSTGFGLSSGAPIGAHPPSGTEENQANGDDGTPLNVGTLVCSQLFTVAANGQPTDDLLTPVGYTNDNADMKIDFGFTASPTAVSLSQIGGDANLNLVWILLAVSGLSLFTWFCLRRRQMG